MLKTTTTYLRMPLIEPTELNAALLASFREKDNA